MKKFEIFLNSLTNGETFDYWKQKIENNFLEGKNFWLINNISTLQIKFNWETEFKMSYSIFFANKSYIKTEISMSFNLG